MNLDVILSTFQFNYGFTIEILDEVMLCVYLFLTHFEMFSNGGNTLQLRLTEIAKVRRVLMQRNNPSLPMILFAREVILNYC